MCQRSGWPPISTIGFGLTSFSSARRAPNPPAKMTTFIGNYSTSRTAESSKKDGREIYLAATRSQNLNAGELFNNNDVRDGSVGGVTPKLVVISRFRSPDNGRRVIEELIVRDSDRSPGLVHAN